MKLKSWLIATLIISSTTLFAQEEAPGLKEKVRPYVERILGTEWSTKILGIKPEVIELPALPKVATDTRSTAVYSKKADEKKANLTKEDEDKLNYFFVKELYAAIRAVEPQGDELSRWLNALEQGGTREGIYRALILDDQYAGLENFNKPTTEGVVNFSKWFFPRFVGVNLPDVEKIGFYTLKREASEKALEIIDAFGNDKTQLHNWYAVFSAELAEKYPAAFKIDLRKSTLKKRHKLWAGTNPEQHLKSEVIIKIHTVFNYLEG